MAKALEESQLMDFDFRAPIATLKKSGKRGADFDLTEFEPKKKIQKPNPKSNSIPKIVEVKTKRNSCWF